MVSLPCRLTAESAPVAPGNAACPGPRVAALQRPAAPACCAPACPCAAPCPSASVCSGHGCANIDPSVSARWNGAPCAPLFSPADSPAAERRQIARAIPRSLNIRRAQDRNRRRQGRHVRRAVGGKPRWTASTNPPTTIYPPVNRRQPATLARSRRRTLTRSCYFGWPRKPRSLEKIQRTNTLLDSWFFHLTARRTSHHPANAIGSRAEPASHATP